MPAALDFSHFDPAIRPQDDLFRRANGGWLNSAQIDADKSGAGAFVDLRDEAERQVRDIVTGLTDDATDEEQAKIATLYESFMATEQIEALGATPLQPILDRVATISSPQELTKHLGWSLRNGIGGIFGFGEEADPGNPSRYVLFLDQAGIGLPDEEYYRLPEHAEIREAYLDYIKRVFELAGLNSPTELAQQVFELETQIASHHWDKIKTRDLREMYNPTTWDELANLAPGFDWVEFATAAELPAEKIADVVACQPSYLTAVAELVSNQPMALWRAWASLRAINSLAGFLSDDFVTARFEFYEKKLSGNEEQRPRWKRAVSLVEGALGEAIGKIYVERHFPESAKQGMDELVANLLAAYHDSISALSWMTDETRTEALDKLAKFTPKIGYPDQWRDYSALAIGNDLVGNALAISSFELDYTLSKLGGPMDPHEWHMYPQTVNAYYHPLRNEIVFPAAILQPPFFNEDADDAVNYAAIGAVIGHEIGHGFDDKGSTCDGDGRLRNWWTEADREAFEAHTARLVDQYQGLSPEGADGAVVNGELTLGENIGDLGGLDIAFKAWLKAGGDPDGEEIDGLRPAQRFFVSWAAAWRGKLRPEATKQRLATDPHSPAEFRCNQVVRNLDSFHAAFGTTSEDALWLDPAERVTIW